MKRRSVPRGIRSARWVGCLGGVPALRRRRALFPVGRDPAYERMFLYSSACEACARLCSCLCVVSGGVRCWVGVPPPVARATSVITPPRTVPSGRHRD